MTESKAHVIQVTNISPNITEEQIKHFLEYIGRIREIKLYPESDGEPNQTKVAYGRYDSAEHVELALHLTNTVMVDRALILVPYPDEVIPDETKALRVAAPMNTVAGMLPPTHEWPSNVVNTICGSGSSQTIQTIDSKLIELGLQQYPNLPGKTDPSKVEEIRRTIYVSNLDPSVNDEQLVQFFSQAGEVMFVRMAGDENLPSRNAYVEFSNQKSVPMALAYNGVMMSNRHLKVGHSLSPIEGKPLTEAQEELTKQIDEAMKKFKDIEHLIHGGSKSSGKRGRSRSKSKDRRRHKSKERRRSRERRRSPSPRKSSRRSSRPSLKKEGDESSKSSSTKDRKRRSRSREKRPSRSRDRDRKRSKSRDKKRSKSRDKKRSRSRDRRMEKSRDRRRRSRSRERRSRSRERRPSRSKDRKYRSRRSSSKDRDRKRKADSRKSTEVETKNGVKVKRDYDAEEKDMDEGASKTAQQNGANNNEEDERNGDKSDSNSDTDTKLMDTSSSSSKTKNAMADLEKEADTDRQVDEVAMDMDTGDDSDTGA